MNTKNDNSCTRCAVIGCNVSYRKEITPEILKNIILGKQEMGRWLGHIDTFFNELPLEIIIGFIKENGISYKELKKKYDTLPKVMKGRNFERITHEYI